MTYSDATISALIDSVNSIEEELGVDPNGVYATVRTRLDILEARINNPFSPAPNVNNPFYIGGSPVSGVSIQAGFGDPTITMPPAIPGSLFLREDGYAGTNVYSFGVDGIWAQISGGSGFTAGGDLSGTSTSQNVIRLQNNAVQSGILSSTQDGYVLTWVNSASQWRPKPVSSGSSFTAGGDLTGTSTSQQVVSLTGTGGIVTVPAATEINFTTNLGTSTTYLHTTNSIAGSVDIISSDGTNGLLFGTGANSAALNGSISSSLIGASNTWQVNGSGVITNIIPKIFTQNVSGPFTFDSDATQTSWTFLVNGGLPVVNLGPVASVAQTGVLRLENATGIYARNPGNSADRPIALTTSGDGLTFGDTSFTGAVSVFGGSHISINNSTNGGAQVQLTSGAGGLFLGNNKAYLLAPASLLQFALNNTSPTINQEDTSTASATGQTFTIQAQNATGTTSMGGNLVLTPGTGTSSNGIIQINGSISLTATQTTWGSTGQQLESDLPSPTTTANNTPTTAFTYAMPDNTALKMDVLVVARDTTTGTSAATFNLSSSYYRSGGAPVIMGTTTSSDPKGTNAGAPPAGWDATITTSSNNIIVQVTGDASDSVKWMVIPQIQTVS